MAAKHTGVVFAFLAVLLAGCGADTSPSRQTATAEMARRATAPLNGAIIATEVVCPNGYRGRFELVHDPGVTAITTNESVTIPGYRWVIEITPPQMVPPPAGAFNIEVFAWGEGFGSHGAFALTPVTVTAASQNTRWHWTDAVRTAPQTNGVHTQGVELWPQWADVLSVSPYRVRYPVPLSVGSIAFDLQEGRDGTVVTRPYIRKGTNCVERPNMIFPDDFPERVGK